MVRSSNKLTKQDIIDQLVKNNVELQKQNVNLLVSMDSMTKKVDELVEIFKKAAEHIEKGEIREPMARKLTDLLEQNKRIAKGLIMLERFVREREGFDTKDKKSEFEDIF